MLRQVLILSFIIGLIAGCTSIKEKRSIEVSYYHKIKLCSNVIKLQSYDAKELKTMSSMELNFKIEATAKENHFVFNCCDTIHGERILKLNNSKEFRSIIKSICPKARKVRFQVLGFLFSKEVKMIELKYSDSTLAEIFLLYDVDYIKQWQLDITLKENNAFGTYFKYHPNGVINSIVNYHNNILPIGRRTEFYEDGTLKNEIDYEAQYKLDIEQISAIIDRMEFCDFLSNTLRNDKQQLQISRLDTENYGKVWFIRDIPVQVIEESEGKRRIRVDVYIVKDITGEILARDSLFFDKSRFDLRLTEFDYEKGTKYAIYRNLSLQKVNYVDSIEKSKGRIPIIIKNY